MSNNMRYSKTMTKKSYQKLRRILSWTIYILLGVLIIGGLILFNHRSSVESRKKNQALLFNDEFDGKSLDNSKWVTCYNNYSSKFDGCTNYGNWESEWYKSSQVRLAMGNLILTAQKQKTYGLNKYLQTQEYSYISGMITSGSLRPESPAKWGHKYGYYEAKIMSPFGQAVWPAFWLLPTDNSWPPEIDVMEIVGSKPNKTLNTFFWKDSSGNTAKDSGTYTHNDNLSNDWHVYGLNWQKDRLEWYLDGKLIREVSSANVPKQPMHIVLNLAIGGTLPGQPDRTTPATLQMLVDYVRVYKSREAIQ